MAMEKINDIIKDTIYDATSINPRLRIAVRAILFNENNQIAYLHIVGCDKFGQRDHLETPGGGVDEGETLEEALKRELSEELGASVDIIKEVGYIDIEYKLLNRIDRENYFICKLNNISSSHQLDYEKELFKGVKWLTMDEALDYLTNKETKLVGSMIHHRERLVLEYIKNNKLV